MKKKTNKEKILQKYFHIFPSHWNQENREEYYEIIYEIIKEILTKIEKNLLI